MRIGDVQVEIVRGIPHGAKLVIDEPEGEQPIVWVDEDELDCISAIRLGSALVDRSAPLSESWLREHVFAL